MSATKQAFIFLIKPLGPDAQKSSLSKTWTANDVTDVNISAFFVWIPHVGTLFNPILIDFIHS